jgi:transposase
MSKHFGELIIYEVERMRLEGKTYREIAEYFNLSNKEVVRNLINREKHKHKLLVNGILPRPKGRPRKLSVTCNQYKDNEIKRLKMENELLRAFLQVAGRR